MVNGDAEAGRCAVGVVGWGALRRSMVFTTSSTYQQPLGGWVELPEAIHHIVEVEVRL